MIENGKLAGRIMRENVFRISETLNQVMSKCEERKVLADLEVELERIDVGLSIAYQGHSELLNSIRTVLGFVLKEDRTVFLANHFLKYGGDLKEIDLATALDYVEKINKHFWSDFEEDFDFFGEEKRFYTEEKRLALFHLDFMERLDVQKAKKRLKTKGGLEKFVLSLSGIDVHCMGEVEYDNFEFNTDIIREEIEETHFFDWEKKKYVLKDNIFHPGFELDKGQVTAYPGGFSHILEDEDVERVVKMFKGTEVVETDEHRYRYDNIEREIDQMNPHNYEFWFGSLDQDDEEYLYGKIEKPNRPVLIRRFLCHTFNLEGEAKKLYDGYIRYQKKRLKGVKKFHDEAFRRNNEHRMDDDQLARINNYCNDDFRFRTHLWMSVLDSAINCLLDQGYGMPKIIEIAETQLNPFKNEIWDITRDLKPILAREYKG